MKQVITQFVINEKGEKSAVIVPMKTYLEMLEKLEELEDIRMYDAVKSRNESSISLEEYRQKRKAKKQNALSSSNS
jgi:PHD/YefM family antitoxin component YafN of YafNO toxin-antitoxin module